jgi:MoxR-like ATPase
MLQMLQHAHPLDSLQPVATAEELLEAQQQVRQVHVDPKVQHYLLQIVHDSRQHEALALGASPRASLALYRSAQAMAAVLGRNYVLPDDIKKLVGSVMGHRLILKPESRLRRITTDQVLEEIVSEIAVPSLAPSV